MLYLFGICIGMSLNDNFARFVNRFGEEIDQFFCIARASLELFPISAKNKTKSNMFRFHLRWIEPTRFFCYGKDHLEVGRLPSINYNDDPVGFLNKNTMADGCKISRVVIVAAI